MRIDLNEIRRMKAAQRKFAMLTAYDFPTAKLAQTAGVHSLLIGDSMGTVLLGHSNTRSVPLDLMITLGEAVRRGAPEVFLVGDLPFESINSGPASAANAAVRFREECGCDAVKLECGAKEIPHLEQMARAGVATVAHLGLRPQQVISPDGYRAQARDSAGIEQLVADAQRAVGAGAAMLLLEAVPNEASEAVLAAVDVPVIGCGAGAACDGYVVVTYDMLGIASIDPPRFVPRLETLSQRIDAAMRVYVQMIDARSYPAAEHGYRLRTDAAPAAADTVNS